MKSIFYKALLNRAKNITPNEKILYSFLVSKSISQIDDVFGEDGNALDMDVVLYYIHENDNHCPLYEINNSALSKELNQSRPTIISGLRALLVNGYITNNMIYISDELVECGYFELMNSNMISGELLVFYSYLLSKSKQYDYVIDTHKKKIAEQFGKSTIAITKLLNRLYILGLAERTKDGKLLVRRK